MTGTDRNLRLALAASLLYGAFVSWRCLALRHELKVYQTGALAMLGRKIWEEDSKATEARMAELGLLSAPNDLPSRPGTSAPGWPRPLPVH